MHAASPAPAAERFAWLQCLRGLAALMVLAFHARPHLEQLPVLAGLVAPTRWGFSGVEVFFALSGFVVFRSAEAAARQGRVGRFVRHRLLRIYLGYWPALAVLALATVVLRKPWPEPIDLVTSTLLVAPDLARHWLGVAWSLQLELWFYAVTALLVAASGPAAARVGMGLLAALVAWHAGWWWLAPDVVRAGREPLQGVLTAFGIEFLAGALIGHAIASGRHAGPRTGLALLVVGGAMAVAGLAAGIASNAAYAIAARAATFGVMAVGLLLVALAFEMQGVAAPRWLQRIGDASFGLYLLHTPLLDLLSAAWRQARRWQVLPGWLELPALLAIPVVIVLASLAWFRFIERPLHAAGLARWGGEHPPRK